MVTKDVLRHSHIKPLPASKKSASARKYGNSCYSLFDANHPATILGDRYFRVLDLPVAGFAAKLQD